MWEDTNKVCERAIIGACNISHVRVDVLSHANTENSLSYSFPEVKVNVHIAVTTLLCWQKIAKIRYRPALTARVLPQRQHVPFLAVLIVCTLAAYLVRYTLKNHRATISKKHLIALLQYGFLLHLFGYGECYFSRFIDQQMYTYAWICYYGPLVYTCKLGLYFMVSPWSIVSAQLGNL